MMQFPLLEIGKRYAALFVIHVNGTNMKSSVLGSQFEDSPEESKELDIFSGDYKGTTAWKPHSDCSDKKRTPEFI